MLYFDLGVYKQDLLKTEELKKPKIIRNIIYFYRKNISQVLKLNIDGRMLIIISKINKKSLKKINKILQIEACNLVCISDELKRKQDFLKFINDKNIKIIDGKWLLNFLRIDILKYICNKRKIKPETQEVIVVASKNSELVSESIKRLSDIVKNINIVTDEASTFKKLVDEIFESKGLIIKISKKLRKNLSKSAIVINLDKSDLNYHVNLPVRFYKNMERFSRFDTTILYESFIYKNTSSKNIWKEIENDKICIDYLEDDFLCVKA